MIDHKTRIAQGSTREARSAAAELRVAEMLVLEGNPVHFLTDRSSGLNADLLVGGVKTEVKWLTGIGRPAAGDLAKGVRQVGAGGEVIAVRAPDTKASLAQFEDFVAGFRAKLPVTFRAVDEDALPSPQRPSRR